MNDEEAGGQGLELTAPMAESFFVSVFTRGPGRGAELVSASDGLVAIKR